MPKYPPLKGTPDDPSFRDSQKHFEEVQKNPSLSDPNFRRSYYQDEDWNGEYHIDMEDSSGHPALNGILAASFNKLFYQKLGLVGDLESYHLFEITISSLLVFVVAIFMWKKYGIMESIISSLVLSTYPLFLGEQHFNIKDPIETAFYTFTLLAAYQALVQKSSKWLLLTSIFFALGLSTKFNIVFIIFPILLWVFIYFYKEKIKFKFSKKFILTAAISPLIILGIFVLFFPPIWRVPIQGLQEIINFYLDTGYSLSQPSKYYLLGFINTYPLTWIFFTTPIISLFLFFTLFLFPKNLKEKNYFSILLLLSLITTIARVSLFGALSYGGVRIIMEYIPVLAMLCGISAGLIFKRVKHRINLKLFISLLIILFLPIIYKLITIHPNENVYFNFFAGGLNGAEEKEINSWGNSYGNAYYPALLWINENAEPDAELTLPVGTLSNIPRFKLRNDISLSSDHWSGTKNAGEYVVELTYDYTPMKYFALSYLNMALKPVYEVKVDRVSIAKVWKNDKEHLLPKYRDEKIIVLPINKIDETSLYDTINLTLPEVEKIMKVSIFHSTENCENLETGYVETSVDGESWVREKEDIARDQLKHFGIKELKPKYEFYFLAKEAKYIKFNISNKNTCLYLTNRAEVTFLNQK